MTWFVSVAFAAVPTTPGPIPTLTADEQGRLAAREIVTRSDLSGSGGGVVGFLDVKAPAPAVWDAILDFDARVKEIGGLQSVQRYDQTDAGLGATWTLKVMGIGATFSMKYALDPSHTFVYYAVDPAKPGDIASGAGSYQLHDIPGGTRIVYRSEMESGAPVPGFVKKWIAVDALQDQLTGIRVRAEAAAP